MNPVSISGGRLIDPTVSDAPTSGEFRSAWSIVVTDRCPGPMGPISIGYVGRHVVPGDSGSIVIGDPFDYQSGWKVQDKSLIRDISVMPCEGFTLATIAIERAPLYRIECLELTDRACELMHKLTCDAFRMRSHFRKAGSLIAQ